MFKRYFTPLRLRLLLVVFIAVLPALGLILYEAATDRASAARDAQAQALRAARVAAQDYARVVSDAERLLMVLARVPDIRAGDNASCSVLLAGMLHQDTRYLNFGVVDKQGQLLCSAIPMAAGLNLADRAYFQRAVQTRRFSVGDFQIGRITRRASINLAFPVLDMAGKLEAVLFSALDIGKLHATVAGATLPEHATITVVDARGTILARYPDSENWVGKRAPEAHIIPKMAANQADGILEMNDDQGDARLFAYAPMKIGSQSPGVYVDVGISKKLVLTDANKALTRHLAIFASITLLIFIGALVAADAFVVKVVNALIMASRRLAAGELQARSGLSYGRGELGELARSFDNMAESLESRELQLYTAQAARANAEARFAGILDIAAEAIIAADERQNIVLFNQGAEQIFGYTATEILGQPLKKLIPERYAAAHGEHVRRFGVGTVTARRMGERSAVFGRRKDGKEFPAEISISKLIQNGQTIYTAILRDITERKKAEEEIRLLQNITLAVNDAPDLPTAVGIVLQKVCEVTGWILGQAWFPQPNDGGQLVCCPTWHANTEGLESFRATSLETRLARGEGLPGRAWLKKEPVWVPDVSADVNFPRAPYARAVGLRAGMGFPVLVNDEVLVVMEFFLREPRVEEQRLVDLVSAIATQLGSTMLRKRSEERLTFLAHHDALTGLPNRVLLSDRLRQAMFEADRHERLVGVVFLDIDRFKKINDSLGHDIGDGLLQEVGKRFSECLRPGDTAARLSGDEFALVLAGMVHVDDSARVAQKVIGTFSQPFVVKGHELFISASIGITLYPLDDSDVEGLLRNADVAMYRAKEQGRNNYQFYAAEMTANTRDRLLLEHDLRYALERGELELHYQPVVNLVEGSVGGVEALLRWHHPTRGLVSPGEFIPVAEETGLILPIGEWVLEQACRQVHAWHAEGLRALSLAVNVSVRQFRQKDLDKTIADILTRVGLDPAFLELELTESLLAETDILATLNAVSALGVRLSVDDFGTGYSALSYLKRFPIDTLKIDRSFVRDVTTEGDTAALTSAIIAMAHTLDIRVIAEGVETEVQLRFLTAQGCDAIQGFYFSKAVPAQQLPESVRATWALRDRPKLKKISH